ncbi:GNAT family N-acetyltransferase [Hymenobacter crusticola]|uniref:GNAT family N-acetyltransferase n=1 Tax=Hymenobacter crusticola TaxID=1770526 RepID=A0A243W5J9_9BACT|nr:GNAT family N-acetyltransferase [Hymenobacter crusticola]OUJ68691.1 GNAT family N-acetyltransferase [Hymenobacter crusticola]
MALLVETERLVLRELLAEDALGMFAMDSDPEVHRYLGNTPLVSLTQSQEQITFIQQQYRENGIGRWAVIDKQTGHFVGWSGLKWIMEPLNQQTHFYELGYHFARPYWGRGYATEAAQAVLQYGFDTLGLIAMYSLADGQNQASNHVLLKLGFTFVERFDFHEKPHNWYELLRPQPGGRLW